MSVVAPAAPAGRGVSPHGALSARRRQTRRRLAVVGLVLAAAAAFLVVKGLTSAVVYFKTAQQAVASRAALGNSTFQIEGVVVPHSSVRKLPGTEALAFTICSGPVRVPVESTGAAPQLFAPGVAVVLVGHFVGSGLLFASDQILVKHSNAYVAAHPGRVSKGDGQTC